MFQYIVYATKLILPFLIPCSLNIGTHFLCNYIGCDTWYSLLGYNLACKIALNGADVQIIDESTPSAISIKADIAKTYPNVQALKDDEPLLSMIPIDVAISKAQILFFAPRIRKTGQDIKTELNSKFKDAVSNIKKGCSVVYCLGTGFGGNSENISLSTKHVKA